MSEQITSAMLDEMERLIAATDPNLYDKWTRGEQLEAHGAYYRRSLELMPALIAAARRAERYEVALREIAVGVSRRDRFGEWCRRCEDPVDDHDAGCATMVARAALTPEPPTIAP